MPALPAISFTPEGGLAVRMINNTGGASVRGTIVNAYGTGSVGFATAGANEDMPIGTVYDAGVADGSPCRIIVAGVAPVLMNTNVAAVLGYVLTCSATGGRADAASTAPAATTHWREIGHVVRAVAGTNPGGLAWGLLHFN